LVVVAPVNPVLKLALNDAGIDNGMKILCIFLALSQFILVTDYMVILKHTG